MIDPQIEDSWKAALSHDFAQPYFSNLKQFLVEEKQQYKVFPPGKQIFSAFNLTPFDKVKVVILGQDPYHDDGQAHGLCFSVPQGIMQPPSLKNIFKELATDIPGFVIPKHGNLEAWAKQGVLLLNATLTVRAHQAGSHQKHGWETFTDSVIKHLSDEREGLVFILWGNYAIAKTALIDTQKHHVLQSVHPSPLSASRGFFGCKHFSKTNELLIQEGLEPINWQV